MRHLRIFFRVIIETGIGVKRSGWSNWLVVSILAIALTIFGGILQLTMTMKNVVSEFGSQLQVSAYLKDGFQPKRVAREISQIPEVQLVEIVTKDVAWDEMKSTFKVASLANPLPNTLHIKASNPEAVEAVAAKVKLLGAVENIRYPLKVARKINELRHFLELAGFVITAALSAATLTVIGNTIHLLIESRQREIEILSLMGVSPFYIKGPFVLQGAAYGAGSAAVAILILGLVHVYLDPYLTDQLVSLAPFLPRNMEYGMWQTFGVMLGLGILVGAGGSAWTSGRYIKV
ncbi:MAG TPA: FtsX-like permease family protein [Candidatus Melainabacteria bacterium]|jgi:cell division transport system permease protein|nr:FtsX-like permease family protein [Candidatus Melainabacteria bacterium]HIN64893.1 FtsX-like permease family protein [Candidatus Obscuribacterales bacterium]